MLYEYTSMAGLCLKTCFPSIRDWQRDFFLESGSSSSTAQERPAKAHGVKRDLTENLLNLRNPELLCGES